jgi:hypothetical protein
MRSEDLEVWSVARVEESVGVEGWKVVTCAEPTMDAELHVAVVDVAFRNETGAAAASFRSGRWRSIKKWLFRSG